MLRLDNPARFIVFLMPEAHVSQVGITVSDVYVISLCAEVRLLEKEYRRPLC